MSKASKKRSHDKKMRAKRAMKAARRTAYAALKGTSKKTKKIKNKRKLFNPSTAHQHLIARCGNPGCKKCFPQFSKKKIERVV